MPSFHFIWIRFIVLLSLCLQISDGCCKKRPGSSKDCKAAKSSKDCVKINSECIWDCDGSILGNLGGDKLFSSVTFVVESEASKPEQVKTKTPGKPKRKFKNGRRKITQDGASEEDLDFILNDWAEIHKTSILRIDNEGVVYRCTLNPNYALTGQDNQPHPAFFVNKKRQTIQQEAYERVKLEAKKRREDWEVATAKAKQDKKPVPKMWEISKEFFRDYKNFETIVQDGVRTSTRRLLAVAGRNSPLRRRLVVAHWDAAGWVNRPAAAAPWTSLGALQFDYGNNGASTANGVGTVMHTSQVNGQHYDWVITAGHNCWDSDANIQMQWRRSQNMQMAVNYHSTPADTDPFTTGAHTHPIAGPYPVGAAGTTLWVQEYRTYSSDEESQGLEYRYDWCIIQFPVAAAAANRVQVGFDSRWRNGGGNRRRLFMATYYVTAATFHWRQVFFQQNTAPRVNKMNFRPRQHFLFTPFEFTEEGTSGSPWFLKTAGGLPPAYAALSDTPIGPTIIGIHVGARDLGTGNDYEIVNRITKPKYLSILRITGVAGTGTGSGQSNGISAAMIDGYGDTYVDNEYGVYMDKVYNDVYVHHKHKAYMDDMDDMDSDVDNGNINPHYNLIADDYQYPQSYQGYGTSVMIGFLVASFIIILGAILWCFCFICGAISCYKLAPLISKNSEEILV